MRNVLGLMFLGGYIATPAALRAATEGAGAVAADVTVHAAPATAAPEPKRDEPCTTQLAA